jgi:hypothetical protein
MLLERAENHIRLSQSVGATGSSDLRNGLKGETVSANDRQEGGNHYSNGEGLQHWDLVNMYRWDYYQSQITKYVMRWKKKHKTHEGRVEDLKKARHFLDKYIEEAERWDDGQKSPSRTTDADFLRPPLNDPAQTHVNVDWQCEGWYGDLTNLYRCKHCRSLFRTDTIENAIDLHGHCAKAHGYVNQG